MHRYDKQALISVARPGFSRTRSVRFQDVDAAGIIFYSRLFELCHDVYVEFLAEHGHPLHQVIERAAWAAPIRHAEADYLKPMRFGDSLEVALTLAHLEPTEVSLGYRVSVRDRTEVAAVVQTVHTFVSLPEFRRCSVPAELVTAFQTLAESPFS